MKNQFLVGIDRDNTINYDDEGGYFGQGDDWQSRLRFLPGVVDGLKLLSSDPRLQLVIATNQPGVAKRRFDEQRVRDVNDCIDSRLRQEGIGVQNWQYCLYVSAHRARHWARRGIPYDAAYVMDTPLKKPGTGMLQRAAESVCKSLDDYIHIFFIGDRATDVETGLNARGTGILVRNGINDKEYFKSLELLSQYPGRVHVANGFLAAAQLVVAMTEVQ